MARTPVANRRLAGSACGKRRRGRPLNSVVRQHESKGRDLTQDPFTTPKAPLEIEVSALRETDFVKSYVCYVLCAMLVGALIGGLIGVVIGAAAGASGTFGPSTQTVVLITSGVATLIANYFVFRFIVIRFIVVKFVPELKRAA